MTEPTNLSLFLVEDDTALRESVERVLVSADLTVTSFANGEDALQALMNGAAPDVLLTDFVLPGRNGIELCAAARELAPRTRLVIMSTRSDEIDVVIGLGAGADDYVIKPFRPRELLARIRAAARKRQPLPEAPRITEPVRSRAQDSFAQAGPLTVEMATRVATYDGHELTLTRAEFDILWLIARRPGEVVRRSELLLAGSGVQNDLQERNVDSHIARLRKKLREAGAPSDLVRTQHGVGYALDLTVLDD